MNKHIVIQQFNKRSNIVINLKELALIEGMKDFSSEKICTAFSSLTGRDMGLKDLELLLLIIDLAEALSPTVLRVEPPFGPSTIGTGKPYWPQSGMVVSRADSVRSQALSSWLQGDVGRPAVN